MAGARRESKGCRVRKIGLTIAGFKDVWKEEPKKAEQGPLWRSVIKTPPANAGGVVDPGGGNKISHDSPVKNQNIKKQTML